MKKVVVLMLIALNIFSSIAYAEDSQEFYDDSIFNLVYDKHISKEVEINIVGDVCFGTNYGVYDDYMKYYEEEGGEYFFKEISDIFENDDLTIANLENVFTDKKESFKPKIYTYKAPTKYKDILPSLGIESYNIINNHMHDFGQEAFDENKKYLDDMGINYFGFSEPSSLDTNEIGWIKNDDKHIYKKGDIKVGLLGYMGFNGVYASEEQIINDVKYLKENDVDYIIAYAHWGGQNTRYVSPSQKRFGKTLIDNDVDLVIGSHPHILQEMEEYKGKRIYYSLGDFFAVWSKKQNKDTVIVNLKLKKNELGEIEEEFSYYYTSFVNGTNYNQVKLIEDKNRIDEIQIHLKDK